jgi:hypothetical protein
LNPQGIMPARQRRGVFNSLFCEKNGELRFFKH